MLRETAEYVGRERREWESDGVAGDRNLRNGVARGGEESNAGVGDAGVGDAGVGGARAREQECL